MSPLKLPQLIKQFVFMPAGIHNTPLSSLKWAKNGYATLCDVAVMFKRQRKIVNIIFIKQDTFFYKKMYVWHFYQKMHTEIHSGLHY